MRWLLRFLAWATVLAPLFWLLGDAYHRALATTTRRLAALLVGLGAMVAIELLTGLLAIHWALGAAAGGSPPGPGQRLRDHLTALPAWIGAPVVWLLLLGRWEFPRAARRAPRQPTPAARA